MENKETFEENLKKLADIVLELEKGDVPLEKTVELYGEGVKISALCRNQLESAKIKITEEK
ncbi:MAG: exodeoxyribonuclease VII small subunit [Ruminococcus sp.]|nr:exodeoxyribonuclease VII small subunit [Ruminococcus sp.]